MIYKNRVIALQGGKAIESTPFSATEEWVQNKNSICYGHIIYMKSNIRKVWKKLLLLRIKYFSEESTWKLTFRVSYSPGAHEEKRGYYSQLQSRALGWDSWEKTGCSRMGLCKWLEPGLYTSLSVTYISILDKTLDLSFVDNTLQPNLFTFAVNILWKVFY